MQSFVDTIKKRLGKPVAAIMTVSEDANTTSASVTMPVVAVMGATRNPAVYMPPNASNVIEGDGDSDMSVSDSAPVVGKQRGSALKAHNENLAPFTVPHLFWHCSVNGLADNFLVTFQALIDHGSHAVLIDDKFSTFLSLKHHKLVEPMPVELAMPEEGIKRIIFLSE